MRRILWVALFVIVFLSLTNPVAANAPISGASASLNYENKDKVKRDVRTTKLRKFLNKYNSPLSAFTKDIIELSDQNQLDYRLVAAISGVESTFCRAIPYNSFNCWGWNNGNHYFADYHSALSEVSQTLGNNYFKRGLNTPESIAPVYAPPSSDWAWKVRFFMNLISEDSDSTFLAKQFSI